MDRHYYQVRLIFGYCVAVIGLVIGFYVFGTKQWQFALLLAYGLWGTYWGVQIVSPFIDDFLYRVPISHYPNVFEALLSRLLQLTVVTVIKIITGAIIGTLGGGLFRQIEYMLILR